MRFETGPASAALAYSPDGKWLAEIAGGGASHRLREAGSGKEVLELTSAPTAGGTQAIAFSPDGSRLACSSDDSQVRIWDVSNVETAGGRAPVRILDGKIALLDRVAWGADGRQVFAASSGGTLLSWPVAPREPRVAVKGSGQIDRIVATAAAAGSRFAAAFVAPDRATVLKVWDDSGKVLFTADATPAGPPTPLFSPKTVALSRDGSRLAYHGWDPGDADGTKPLGRLRVWDVATGREVFHRDDDVGLPASRRLQPRRAPTRPGIQRVERHPGGAGALGPLGLDLGSRDGSRTDCTWTCHSRRPWRSAPTAAGSPAGCPPAGRARGRTASCGSGTPRRERPSSRGRSPMAGSRPWPTTATARCWPRPSATWAAPG